MLNQMDLESRELTSKIFPPLKELDLKISVGVYSKYYLLWNVRLNKIYYLSYLQKHQNKVIILF